MDAEKTLGFALCVDAGGDWRGQAGFAETGAMGAGCEDGCGEDGGGSGQ